MSSAVFALVLAAAVVHALWNFAARKVAGNVGVLWLSVWTAGLLCLPFAVHVSLSGASIEGALPFTLATGVLHAIYFILLAKAYEKGEISFVYPIARGTGVALTCLVAALFLREAFSWVGALGVASIAVGILCLGHGRLQAGGTPATFTYALGVGVAIGGYSIVDKLGVERAHPIWYLCAIFLLSGLLLAPYVLTRHAGACVDALRGHKKYILAVGVGAPTSYLIILFCFQVGNVGYIVAIREFAVVIGSALGIACLKEELTPKKGLGIAGIVLGLVAVRLGG